MNGPLFHIIRTAHFFSKQYTGRLMPNGPMVNVARFLESRERRYIRKLVMGLRHMRFNNNLGRRCIHEGTVIAHACREISTQWHEMMMLGLMSATMKMTISHHQPQAYYLRFERTGDFVRVHGYIGICEQCTLDAELIHYGEIMIDLRGI